MVQGKWFAPGEDLSEEVLPLQRKIFGISGNNPDQAGWNTLVYLDQLPVASGRIWWHEDAFWLGNIGVLPEYRGRRLGDLVLRLLLFKAQSHAAREVRLRCSQDTEAFFARLGFYPVIRNYGTVEMKLPGDEISLDSCNACKKTNCPNRR